jgi:tetratricopeptide (TPR) repeat protein
VIFRRLSTGWSLYIATLLVCIVMVPTALSQSGTYGTELPFTAGAGGRVSALGLAGSSLTGSPSLQHFNPAGLAELQFKELEFYRTTYFDSKSAYHTFHYAHPMLNYGTLGISVLRLDVGGIEERDVNNILLSDDMKNAQTRLLIGYAASLHSALAAGINLKIDNQSFGQYSGSGVGLDLGFLATREFTGHKNLEYLRAGLSILNLIEPVVKLDQDDVADPLAVVFGGSGAIAAGEIGFVTAIDIVAPRFSPYRFRFGQEVSYMDMLVFRFGFDGSIPTAGVGAAWRNVSVDYAYRNEDLGSNHRISVSIRFGSSLKARREANQAVLEAELDRKINSKLSDLESSQLAETIRRADSLFTNARYSEASSQYELALLWDDQNDRAKSQITTCQYYDEMQQVSALMDTGDYLEALYHLRQAQALSPSDPEITALMTECNRRIKAQEDHTDMIDGMLKRSIDLYASRQFIEARAGFHEVLRLAPYNTLANEYEQKANINIQNQKQALVIEANGLAKRGSYEAAIDAVKEAKVLDPDDVSLDGRIAELRRKQQIVEQQSVAEAQEKSSPATTTAHRQQGRAYDSTLLEPKYNEGLRYFNDGQYEEAARRFYEIWAAAPEYHNVTDLLTKTYLFIGMKKYSEENYREAIINWEKVLTVDPDNPKARRYLLKARDEAGRLSKVKNG